MNIEIKNMWRKKSWSIPDLLGSKSEYTKIVVGLINQIASGNANGMDEFPEIEGVPDLRTWREYSPFLKGIGIVGNHNGSLCLSETGEKLYKDLEVNKKAPASENTTYTLKNAKAAVNRLKMITDAIEKGIEK